MTDGPYRPDRDPRDDAAARRWAEETRQYGEDGTLTDDSVYLARKLVEEKRKGKRS